MNLLKEFFGFGGYSRQAEGFLSWQHILLVSVLLAIMTVAAIHLGKKYKDKDYGQKNRVLKIAAIVIDACEIFKIIIICLRSGDASLILINFPLFLCSIQLITIPIAAFSRGRLKDAALDFVFIFGLLGAVLGTVGAGNIYSSYPVLSFDSVISGITHSISGFATIYIGISGMKSLKKENQTLTYIILLLFSFAAYVANVLIDYNYMFLMRGDGTPYDILFNLVGGNKVIYPLCVVALFVAYIALFYFVYYKIHNKKKAEHVG